MNSPDLSAPGERLRAARRRLDLSQATMASELGIAQSTLADYERGKYDPPHPVALALEYRYGIAEPWLARGEGPMFLPGRSGGGGEAEAGAVRRPLIVTDRRELERLEELEGTERFYAVPYLRDAAAAGEGLLVEDAVEGYCVIHERVARRPENLRCLCVSGESMAPLLPDGSIVAVDITLTSLRVVEGKVVCARTESGEVVVKRLRLQGRYALLASDNPDQDRHPPLVVDLETQPDVVIGQVVWAWVDLR